MKKPNRKLYKCMYLIKNSFNGMGLSYSENRWTGNTKHNYIKLLEPYQDKLKGVKILKQDYKTILKKYDHKDAFIYFDPPYEVF